MNTELSSWENEGGAILPEISTTTEPNEPNDLQALMQSFERNTIGTFDCLRLFRYLVASKLAYSLPKKYGYAQYASYLVEKGLLESKHTVMPAAGISDFYEMGING